MKKNSLVLLLLIITCLALGQQSSIQFNNSGTANAWVKLGNNANLGLFNFTLECWFKRTGSGVIATTGTGGVTNAVPLITKGEGESDGSNVDCNYFFGVRQSDSVLVADFEEGALGTTPGLNHPVIGKTHLTRNIWYHGAITYNGTVWNLYLNGVREASLSVGQPCQGNSIQHSAIGSACNSTGANSGYFAGLIDEARIWNTALTQAQIMNNMRSEITSPTTSLVARWGLNEGFGVNVVNSGTATTTGTLTGTNYQWSTQSPFTNLTPGNAQSAIVLNAAGTPTSWVKYGDNPNLKLFNFTLECWLKRTATGVTCNSGTGGIVDYPLITKGRDEADGSTVDCNYQFGIQSSDSTLGADFEEGTAGTSPGLNHPIKGKTPLQRGVWYHAAVTYDGQDWKLYVNGVLDNTLHVALPCQGNSIQHSGIGTAVNSTGVNSGYFGGVMDEARIWNTALTQNQIVTNMNSILPSPTPSLVARFGFDEGAGTLVNNSGTAIITGTIQATNYSWASLQPQFINPVPSVNIPIIPPNQAPVFTPSLSVPGNSATCLNAVSTQLSVKVNDANNDSLWVKFYGREKNNGKDFSIIPVPDTQFYTGLKNGANNSMYKAQMNWVVNKLDSANIQSIIGLGDCTDDGDSDENEWKRCDTVVKIVETNTTTAFPDGIPILMSVGNHDQFPNGDVTGTTTFFNQYFGAARFTGRNYYGGHYGTNNNNNYQFFTASGMDFLVISLEWDSSTNPNPAVLAWAENLVSSNPNKKVIVVSHYILNEDGTFGNQGAVIYNALKSYPNVFLTLSGHVSSNGGGESRRMDVFNGNTIHSVMSDYQSYAGGGDGWFRVMTMRPSQNLIDVYTLSPYLNQVRTGANSRFTLSHDFGNAYTLIDSVKVASGQTASVNWNNLQGSTGYEWYASVSDGSLSSTNSVSNFTTGAYKVKLGRDSTHCGPLLVSPSNTICTNCITSYSWSNGTNAPSSSVSVSSQIILNVVDSLNCFSSDTMNVTIANIPAQAGTISGNLNICSGSVNIYSVAPVAEATSYAWTISGWSGASTNNSISLTSTNSTAVISVIAQNSCGISPVRTIQITPNSVPATPLSITGNSLICGIVSNGYGIAAVPNATAYVWNIPPTWSGSSNSNTIQVSPNPGVGNISVAASNSCGVGSAQSLTVSAFVPPNLNIIVAGSNSICLNASVTLYASGASSYTWNNVSNNSALNVSPSVNTTYSVLGLDVNGCSNSASVVVNVWNLPTVSISGSSLACAGDVVNLSASGANTYLWSNGNALASFNTSLSNTTTYSVTGTDGNGCNNTASKTVTVNLLPLISITGNNTICQGDNLTLSANGASTYTWNTFSNNASIVVSPGATTVYSVNGLDINGCANSAVKTIVVNSAPQVSIAATATTICAGDNLSLNAFGANSYTWSTLSNTPFITVSPLINTSYSVTGIDANGCGNSASVVINVANLPTVSISGTSLACAGDVINLSANGANTYMWSNGSTSASFSASLNNTTTYSVTGTDVNGCNTMVYKVVTVNPLPLVSINGNNTMCLGESLTLSGNGASTYTWSTFSNSVSIVVSPGANMTYSLYGADINGCSNTASFAVTVNALPNILIVANPTTICSGESSTLTVSGVTSYTWSTFQMGSSIVVAPSITSTYGVFGVNADNCENENMFTLNVNICTGVEDIQRVPGFNVYPNPSKGEFFFEGSFESGTEVLIMNVLGQKMLYSELNNGKNNIRLEAGKGIYLYQITSKGKQVATGKLIVE